MNYEEFLLTTNGMQDAVANRFCALYSLLKESAYPLPFKLLLTRVPNSTRGQINYLLGLNGDPAPKVSEFFQRTMEGFYTLSPVGKKISGHVQLLEQDLASQSRSDEIKPSSLTRIKFFERAHEEAKEELEKQYSARINQLEMENEKLKSGSTNSGSGAIKDGPEFFRAFVDLVKANQEIANQILDDEFYKQYLNYIEPISAKQIRDLFYSYLYVLLKFNS